MGLPLLVVGCSGSSEASSAQEKSTEATTVRTSDSSAATQQDAAVVPVVPVDAVDAEEGNADSGTPDAAAPKKSVWEMLGALDDIDSVENPKWFTPSKELRASLFGVSAVKQHFSLDAPRAGALRLHAQQDADGDWYVALTDGDNDTAGPAASCHMTVTNDPKGDFQFFMPKSLAEKSAAASEFLGGELAGLAASTTMVDQLEKRLEGRDDVPPKLAAKLESLRVRTGTYEPIPIEWGDEAWASVFHSANQGWGNAVIARKDKHVIMLEWRGAVIEDSAKLLAFVKPHLDRLAASDPGEAWVAEWLDTFSVIYETEE